MPIERNTDRIVLTHPKGSSAEILFYGATIISWRASNHNNSDLQERLFVSSKAVLDGTKPVRGGIPVVFPCFGAPTHPEHVHLAQHGFARSEIWSWGGLVMDNEAGVSVRLTLDPNSSIRSRYSKAFRLDYVVTLAEHQLSTDIHVKNTSDSDGSPANLEFQALLHTYIRSPADQVSITPLHGLKYYDKTETTDEARSTPKLETRESVDVLKSTDSVYENASQDYRVSWPDGGLSIRAKNFRDVVVWNPQENGQKIGDMEDGGWKRYVCVEPGFVRGFIALEPGKEWIGQQVLSLL